MFNIPDFPIHIIQRLHQAGHEAYIVGGAIRDMCLKRYITDWDMATSASQDAIKAIFHDLKHFHLKHETVTLVHEGSHYEVTPFKGPQGVISSVAQDLAMRDFTINAMAFDIRRNMILDPYRGQEDLLKKVIRAVGNPRDRFTEDPLRMLRAIRLAAEMGFSIDPISQQIISAMAGQLGMVARERVRVELMKILTTPKPSRAFSRMNQLKLLPHVLPELMEGIKQRQNLEYHRYSIYKHTLKTVDLIPSDPLLRLAALLHDIAKPRVRKKDKGQYRFIGHETASAELAENIMERLGFSGSEIKKVGILVRYHMIDYRSEWSDGAIRRLLKQVGSENINSLLTLRRSDLSAHGFQDFIKMQHLSELEGRIKQLNQAPLMIQTRDLAVNGKEIMRICDLGPGPKVGEMLDFLVAKVIESPDLNTREHLIRLLHEIKSNKPGYY